jgi:hypothetical protein
LSNHTFGSLWRARWAMQPNRQLVAAWSPAKCLPEQRRGRGGKVVVRFGDEPKGPSWHNLRVLYIDKLFTCWIYGRRANIVKNILLVVAKVYMQSSLNISIGAFRWKVQMLYFKFKLKYKNEQSKESKQAQ